MPQNLFSKNSKITFSNVRIEYRVHVLISIKRFRRGKSLLSSRWVIIPAVKYILAKYQKRNKPLIKYFLSDWGENTVFGRELNFFESSH